MANSNGWGDGAKNNLIGWGQGAANNSIGWGSSHYVSWSGDTDIIGVEGVISYNFQERVLADGGTFEAGSCLVSQLTTLNDIAYTPEYVDANAQAFLTATGITDITTIYAVNDLVIDLKADGLWSKMKAIYPFVGGTATTHKFNLVNPADTNGAFRLAFNGGWTHSSNGATPNGVNGFANTNLIATNILTNNSTHLSFYSRTNVSLAQQDMGVQGTNPNRFNLELSYNGSLASDQYNFTTGRVSVANANSTGYYIGTRTTSSIHKVFKNNAQIGATNTGASGSLSLIPLIPIYIGIANNNGNVFWSTKQVAFSTIGDGLTDEDSANLYTRVQSFQTTLGRQI